MLLALLIAAAGINPTPLVDGVGGTPYPLALPRGCRDRLCARGSDDMVPAFFEFAPLGGTGMGTACGMCINDMMGYPESIDLAPWTLENSGAGVTVITANAKAAPNGTLSAERLQIPATIAGQWSAVFQQPPGTIYPGAHSGSMYVAGNASSGATDLCLWNGAGHTCATCNYVPWPAYTLCTVQNVTPSDNTLIFTFGNGTGFNGGITRSALDLYAWGGQVNVGATVNVYQPIPTGQKGEGLTFTRASSATCLKTVGLAPQLVANGDMVTCQTGQPRVMPGTDGTSVNGQLDEAARTNTVIQSQAFDNAAWTKLGVAGAAAPIVTADQATAPDGTLTAERIQFAATSGAQESDLSQVISNASASSATVYFKGNGTTGILDLCLWNGATYTCTACTFVAAGWTRCEVDNVNGGGASATILFGNATVRNGGTARAANDVFAWGADWEVGDYASSYIATTSAGVARVADLADVAITLPTLTQLCVGDTIITPSSITASQAVLTGTLGDGTLGGAAGSTNYFTSQYSGGTALAVTAGAGTPTSATFGSALTGAHRYTVFHTGTLLSGCVDGVCAAGTAGSFSNPTFTRFRLGMFAVTSNNMGGITKLVTIDPVFSRCR